MFESILKVVRGIMRIRGNTDGTLIGNTGSKLNIVTPSTTTTGSLTALNSTVSVTSLDGLSTTGVLITGTWVGTITFEGSVDGSTFASMSAVALGLGVPSSTTTANGSFRLNITGLSAVRVKMTSYTSGTASITMQTTAEAGVTRTSAVLVGGTTGTVIGNTVDALKVVGGTQANVNSNTLYTTAVEVSMATGGNDNPLVLLRNPNGSGKTLYIYKIILGVSVTNTSATFKIFHTPTITTNGTSETISVAFIGNSQPSSAALATSTPTISANGTKIASAALGQNSSPTTIDEWIIGMKANTALLITGDPSSNGRTATITIIWSEV